MTGNDEILPYAAVVIKLLKGNVFKNDTQTWNDLIQYEPAIKQYFSNIGINLFVNENDGYAFLNQKEFDESSETTLPALIGKRALSYSVTLLCVILTEKLLEQNVRGSDSPYLVVDKKDLYNSVRPLLPDTSNETKFFRDIDTDINTLKRYGFLRQLKTDENKFEVRKILCAKIPAEKLQEIKEKMLEYVQENEVEHATELAD
jgi:hypothetical protein